MRSLTKKLATKVVGNGQTNIAVVLYGTSVVVVKNNQITLNTGGWFTTTTKQRMNQASQEFNLGYSVYAAKGHWYVEYKNVHIRFVGDGVSFKR